MERDEEKISKILSMYNDDYYPNSRSLVDTLNRIEAGERPIDISIDKWNRALLYDDFSSIESWTNCGLCVETKLKCEKCPLVTYGYGSCRYRNDNNEANPFYRFCDAFSDFELYKIGIADVQDAIQDMLDMLISVKEKLNEDNIW